MHASLAVALAYDRYINSSSNAHHTLEECHHLSQSTKLLSRRLKEPINAKDKDPIWGTAAALAVLAFTSPIIRTPQESWPLKSDPSGLEWLHMNERKMALWHILDPLRSDSVFRVMAATFARMNAPFPQEGIDGLPGALAAVCDLDDSSTPESSPLFYPAHAVGQILVLPDTEVTTGQTQLFTRSIHGSFKELLLRRDPIALLLLYLWYQKASRSIWWIEPRARAECPLICAYLRLHHKEIDAVQAFLPGGALANAWD
jgi:hypothetical protein